MNEKVREWLRMGNEKGHFVDADTYQSAIEAVKSGTEMCGSLEINNSLTTDSVEVFMFVSDSIH